MAAGGSLSRSERKAAARAEMLRQEELRERRRQVPRAPAPRPAPPLCQCPCPRDRAPVPAQVSRVLQTAAAERSAEDTLLLGECEDVVRDLERRRKKREGQRRRQEEVGPGRRGRSFSSGTDAWAGQ